MSLESIAKEILEINAKLALLNHVTESNNALLEEIKGLVGTTEKAKPEPETPKVASIFVWMEDNGKDIRILSYPETPYKSHLFWMNELFAVYEGFDKVLTINQQVTRRFPDSSLSQIKDALLPVLKQEVHSWMAS